MRRLIAIFCALACVGFFGLGRFGGLGLSAQETVFVGTSENVLTLESAREQAYSESAKVKNAALDTKAAEEQRKEVLWEYFPGVSLTGGAFHALTPLIEIEAKDIISGNSDAAHTLVNQINDRAHEMGIDPVYRTLNYGSILSLTFMQPVFAGGRIVNANRLAAVGYDAAVLKESISSREISAEVDEAFFTVVLLQEKQKTVDRALVLVDSLYNNVASACRAGLAVEKDLQEVSSRRSALKGDGVRLRNGLLLSKMALCNLIGKEYVLTESLATASSPYIGALVCVDRRLEEEDFGDVMRYYRDEEALCHCLDEMELLSLAEKASQLQKKIAIGEALPQVALGGSYGYNNLMNHNKFNGMLYATVKIPLTSWGKTAHKARRFEYAAEKAANDREYLSKQLLLQVRKFWLDVVEAREAVDIKKEALETASLVFNSLQSQYSAGEITLTELLHGEISLRTAEEEYLESRVEYLKALQRYLSL